MINVEIIIGDRSLSLDVDPSIDQTDYRLVRLIKLTTALVGHLKLVKLDLKKVDDDYVFECADRDGRKWGHALCTLCDDPLVTLGTSDDWRASEIVALMEYQAILMGARDTIALETLEYGIIA